MEGLKVNPFQRVHLNNLLVVKEIVINSNLLYDIDIVNGNIIGALARQSLKKYKQNTVQLLRYNNHICYIIKSLQYLRPFVAPTVILSSTKRQIWSVIKRQAVIVLKICIQRMFTKFEKLYLINWTLLELPTLLSKNSSKI